MASANGITGAREMGYYVDTTLRVRSDIAAGREIGPRFVVGVRVDGMVTKAKFVGHVATEQDGIRAVDTLSRRKDGTPRADFIKTYSWVPRPAYFGIVAEAKKLGVPFAGHVPYSVSVVEASDAGQRSIEHEDDLMRACSSQDSALRRPVCGVFSARASVRFRCASRLPSNYSVMKRRRIVAGLSIRRVVKQRAARTMFLRPFGLTTILL